MLLLTNNDYITQTNILSNDDLRSVSGKLDVMEELVEVRVVTDGGRTGSDSPESHVYVYLIDK